MRGRPPTVVVAAVLLALLSLANLLSPLFPFVGVRTSILYLSAALGALGLIGAVGLWALERWGLWLSVAVCVLGILWAAPAMALATVSGWGVAQLVGDIGFALVSLLVLLAGMRRAGA